MFLLLLNEVCSKACRSPRRIPSPACRAEARHGVRGCQDTFGTLVNLVDSRTMKKDHSHDSSEPCVTLVSRSHQGETHRSWPSTCNVWQDVLLQRKKTKRSAYERAFTKVSGGVCKCNTTLKMKLLLLYLEQ